VGTLKIFRLHTSVSSRLHTSVFLNRNSATHFSVDSYLFCPKGHNILNQRAVFDYIESCSLLPNNFTSRFSQIHWLLHLKALAFLYILSHYNEILRFVNMTQKTDKMPLLMTYCINRHFLFSLSAMTCLELCTYVIIFENSAPS
jgi:hypothetical protein